MAHIRRINPDKEPDGTIHPLQCPKERVLHNPRLTAIVHEDGTGEATIGHDVETQPLVADGYTELCLAVHEIRDHPKAGDIAIDVLAHLVSSFSQDPHALGVIRERVQVTLKDAQRMAETKDRQKARAFNPITGDGDTSINRDGSYRGTD